MMKIREDISRRFSSWDGPKTTDTRSSPNRSLTPPVEASTVPGVAGPLNAGEPLLGMAGGGRCESGSQLQSL
jgi:hypothetical protein